MIDAVQATSNFGVEGGYGPDHYTSAEVLGDADLQIRYLSDTGAYQVKVGDSDWASLIANCGSSSACNGFDLPNVGIAYSYEADGGEYQFSNILYVDAADTEYYAAFGMPTDAANVPTSGSAQFHGNLVGSSTSYWEDAWCPCNGWIGGTIDFDMDFGSGNVDGLISPYTTFQWDDFTLDPLVMNGQLASNSNSFSGIFVTDLTGTAEWTGLLTGPNAEEAIGSFTFPYILPADGNQYQASGAWMAKR